LNETKSTVNEYLNKGCQFILFVTNSKIKLIFVGVRLFEIAELFCNAHIIKDAFFEYGLTRSEVCIALKVWPKNRTADMLYSSCKRLIESSKLEAN
jgi:diketogulonate reductase-like aldo/keto reductase